MVAYSDATKPETAWLEWGVRVGGGRGPSWEEGGSCEGRDKEDSISIFLFLALFKSLSIYIHDHSFVKNVVEKKLYITFSLGDYRGGGGSGGQAGKANVCGQCRGEAKGVVGVPEGKIA